MVLDSAYFYILETDSHIDRLLYDFRSFEALGFLLWFDIILVFDEIATLETVREGFGVGLKALEEVLA